MENGSSYKGRGGGGGGGGGGSAASGGGATDERRNPQRYGSRPQYGYSPQRSGGGGDHRSAGMKDKIKERVNTELSGPQFDLPPLDTAEKKFNASSRLFVGNLPRDIPYEELKGIFAKYGELGQVYFNKEGAYAFINFDFRANAEKAKRELQGTEVRNRPLKIRFASITTGVRVKNLTGCVSNELLEKAFNVFGQIEACRVIVDDRGKPTGEGIVIFADKKGATLAVKKCHEECYFLTSALRPVIVEPLEARDEEEGNPESSMHKNDQYKQERKEGPRFADRDSFEYEYGVRWKRLYEMYKEKKLLLESDLQAEVEQLERRLAIVKHEHETEKLRQELLAREQEAVQMGRSMYMRGTSSYSSNYSSLGGYSSGLSNNYSNQSSGYGSSGGYGSQGSGYSSQGGYGGSDRYQGQRDDRYGEYDNRRGDDRYGDDRYQRVQDDRYHSLQEERYKAAMHMASARGGATPATGGGAGGGSGSGSGAASSGPGAGSGPGNQPFQQGGGKREPGAPGGGGQFQQQSDQAGGAKRDNMPGGGGQFQQGGMKRDSMPGGGQGFQQGGMKRDNMPGGGQGFQQGGMKRDNMPGGGQGFQQGGMKREDGPGGGGQFQQGGAKREDMPGGGPGFQQGGMKRDNLPGGGQGFQQGGMKRDDGPTGGGGGAGGGAGAGGAAGAGAGQQFQQGGMKRDNMPGGVQQFPQGGMKRDNLPLGGGPFPQGPKNLGPGLMGPGGVQFPQGGMKREMSLTGQQFPPGMNRSMGLAGQFPAGIKRDNLPLGGQFPVGGIKRDAVVAGGNQPGGGQGSADVKRPRY
ncbi:hrp65 protein-like isoform X1 [Portunus trituberculatus]|uniref:hrp65 protein-like isoform X1 n=1 Tax=Portunus trituberculatus TaxID=210409 RepID=UPI001E1D1C76|nr:hrp65 protein-like isoform X1 [Portunus trituberculatus]